MGYRVFGLWKACLCCGAHTWESGVMMRSSMPCSIVSSHTSIHPVITPSRHPHHAIMPSLCIMPSVMLLKVMMRAIISHQSSGILISHVTGQGDDACHRTNSHATDESCAIIHATDESCAIIHATDESCAIIHATDESCTHVPSAMLLMSHAPSVMLLMT